MALKQKVGLSLPPQVEGQLRCFLLVRVGKLLWSIPTPPKDIQIHVLWWGETGKGNYLRPEVASGPHYLANKDEKQVYYPIRCGPKQFSAYLKDMYQLHLNVVYGKSRVKFAEVVVDDITKLEASVPISKQYNVVCIVAPYKKKLVGKVEIEVLFRTISDTYNVTSSIVPTTDQNYNDNATEKKKIKKKNVKKRVPSEKRVKISQISPDRYLYAQQSPNPVSPHPDPAMDVSFVVGPGASFRPVEESGNNANTSEQSHEKNDDASNFLIKENIVKKKSGSVKTTYDKGFEEEKPHKQSQGSSSRINEGTTKESFKSYLEKSFHDTSKEEDDIVQPFISKKVSASPPLFTRSTKISPPTIALSEKHQENILSHLIEKGQSLKNAMIKSTVQGQKERLAINSDEESKYSGSFIQELLKDSKSQNDSTSDIDFTVLSSTQKKNHDVENRAVDLLIGEDEGFADLMKKLDVSDDEKISEDGDPLHDSSLLSELFYTTKVHQTLEESSIILTDDEVEIKENIRTKKTKTFNTSEKDKVGTSENNYTSFHEGSDGLADELSDTSVLLEMENDNGQSQGDGLKILLPDKLSIQKITELGRVKSIKLLFHRVKLNELVPVVSGNNYFIEFKFPVSISIKDGDIGTETICLVSRKNMKNDIIFERCSVVPVLFDEKMIAYWWNNYISFKFYCKYFKGERPVPFADAYLKLREILISEGLDVSFDISLYGIRQEALKTRRCIGILNLSFVCVPDKRGSKNSINEPQKISVKNVDFDATQTLKKALTPVKIKPRAEKINETTNKFVEKLTKLPLTDFSKGTGSLKEIKTSASEPDVIQLQHLIFVSQGKNFSQSSERLCNLYFICRVFWSDAMLQSSVCWDTYDPLFNWQKIIPVEVNAHVLKKMENNWMVIEVWNKHLDATKDKLIGMCRLSLHQYYCSLKNKKLSETILKSKFPLISYDGWLSVQSLISKDEVGSLNILSALGSHDQVMELVQLRGAISFRKETVYTSESNQQKPDDYVEHSIELTVEQVNRCNEDIDGGDNCGESDCYIQYQFPQQTHQLQGGLAQNLVKTRTCLHTSSPVFSEKSIFVYTFGNKSLFQENFQKAFTNASGSDSNKITFELWKRSYQPNAREQIIAKGYLPVDKILAMVSLYRNSEESLQSFEIQLYHTESEQRYGKLLIFVRYSRNNVLVGRGPIEKNIQLTISVLKLCGLKSAVDHLSKYHRKHMSYHMIRGFNIYVKFHLNFQEEEKMHSTEIVANSFAPVFNYHVEYNLPIKLVAASFAEVLETGKLICRVMLLLLISFDFRPVRQREELVGETQLRSIRTNRSSLICRYQGPDSSHKFNEDGMKELQLGSSEIPLSDLLSRETGIKDWFLVENATSKKERVIGGIEVAIKFPNPSARKEVINRGYGSGWRAIAPISANDEAWLPIADAEHTKPCNIQLSIDTLSIPVNVIYKERGDEQSLSLRIYAKYKFYDQERVTTNPRKCGLMDGKYVCRFSHFSDFRIFPSKTFQWYLREENFEVQFWTCKSDSRNSKLLGSCFVNMSRFSHSPYAKSVLSAWFHLFKNGENTICTAKVKIYISFNEIHAQDLQTSDNSDLSDVSEVDNNDICSHEFKGISAHKVKDQGSVSSKKVGQISKSGDEVLKEKIHFHIEEALHLPKVLVKDSYEEPNVYASYQIASDDIVYTPVCSRTVKPKWNFHVMENIAYDKIKNTIISFKVWKCVGENVDHTRDVLMGAAVVDTSPLFSGMKQILGWYHILDFNGQIVGQIKIGIIPTNTLSPSRSLKYFKKVEFIEPINLEFSCFTNQFLQSKNEDVAVDSISKSTLFEQLKNNLNDLHCVTRRIESCANNEPTHTINSAREVQNGKPFIVHDVEKKINGFEKTAETIQNDGNSQNTQKSESSNQKSIDLVTYAYESDIENQGSQLSTEDNSSKRNTHENELEITKDDDEDRDGDEQADSSCDETDELLNHLREFENKYNYLKKLAHDDSDSVISDNEVLDVQPCRDKCNKNLCRQEQPVEPVQVIFGHDDTDATYEIRSNEVADGKDQERQQNLPASVNLTNIVDDVVNISSGEPTKEDEQIDTPVKESEIPREGIINDDFNSAFQEVMDHPIEDSNPHNECEDTVPHSSDSMQSAVSSPNLQFQNIESTTRGPERISMPNFFMKPQEMADSMKALRIAANFRKSPRISHPSFATLSSTSDYSDEDPNAKNTAISKVTVPRNTKVSLQEQVREHLPVDASEMARIASIFASKNT